MGAAMGVLLELLDELLLAALLLVATLLLVPAPLLVPVLPVVPPLPPPQAPSVKAITPVDKTLTHELQRILCLSCLRSVPK